ncbi:MAG: ABC transporter permease [Leptospirales bacterium]
MNTKESIKWYKAPLFFLVSIWKERTRITYMVKADIKNQYIQSYMGIFWAFFKPVLMTVVISVVFSLGLRGAGRVVSGDQPFIVYFLAGYVSWIFFSGMITASVTSISSYGFLIKKVDFPLFILPVVKMGSLFFVHLALVSVLLFTIYLNGVQMHWYWIQIFYYMFCAIIFLIGLSWTLASATIFIPDLNQAVPVIIQLMFWTTPIFWELSRFPDWAKIIIKMNPAYYIVSGYRDSLIYQTGFWEHTYLSLYFWTITVVFLFIGAITYRNTRPHFAEVVDS